MLLVKLNHVPRSARFCSSHFAWVLISNLHIFMMNQIENHLALSQVIFIEFSNKKIAINSDQKFRYPHSEWRMSIHFGFIARFKCRIGAENSPHKPCTNLDLKFSARLCVFRSQNIDVIAFEWLTNTLSKLSYFNFNPNKFNILLSALISKKTEKNNRRIWLYSSYSSLSLLIHLNTLIRCSNWYLDCGLIVQ